MPNQTELGSRDQWATSLSLLAGVRANEAEAWVRFEKLYAPLFNHWFRLANVARGDWDDLRQEAFLAITRGLAAYQSRPGIGFRAWLRVLIRSKVIDHHRKRVPVSMANWAGEIVAPLSQESPDEERVLFNRALELIETDFEPKTWRAFWRVTIEDAATAVVAGELGLTLNAVYLARARVLRRLREEFEELLTDPFPPFSGLTP